jgi:hypothetical protein
MNKKIRYSLIAAGFIVFFILAPLIVMYVRGLTFDFAQKKFVQTGILAIRSEPKDAQVFLDGKLVLKSAGDLKFLLPKEYTLALRKNGFFDWGKRLEVVENQVTWASPPFGKIFLFLNPPKISTLSETAANFSRSSKTLFYLDGNNLVITHPDKPDQSENILLSKQMTDIVSSADGKQLLLNSTSTSAALYVNIQTKQLADLGELFSEPAKWQFSGNGDLYAQDKDQLYRVDWQTNQKFLIQNSVKSLTFLNTDAYMLKVKNSSLSLQIFADPGGAGQEILGNIPMFTQAQIFVGFQKQIFLLGDGALYKVNSSLTPLASGVQSLDFNSQASSLIYFHDGELDNVDASGDAANFITRRGGALANPLMRPDLNYAFFIEDNKIKALELDTRDRQNEYDLYDGVDIKKFSLDDSGKILTVLDGDKLKTVTIR